MNQSAQTTQPDSQPLALEVRGLTKTYGDHEVVKQVSFDIPRGSVVGLLGPNGAGKTTIMKCLLGLVSTTAGSFSVLGSSPGDSDWHHKLRRVGAMIEAPPLYMNMSARKNLEYQRRAVGLRGNGQTSTRNGQTSTRNGQTSTDSTIDELLELVDLADRANDRPSGYSLGMKQRLGIAVSLVNNPELVILDEPANGLDPQGIVEIRELLQRLPSRGATVLVSSHQLSEVQQACDHLLIISQGAVIESGSTEEILCRNNADAMNLTFDDDDSAALALALLRDQGFAATLGSPRIVSIADPSTGSAINRLLTSQGLYASGIHQPQASLEETFLNLTAN